MHVIFIIYTLIILLEMTWSRREILLGVKSEFKSLCDA